MPDSNSDSPLPPRDNHHTHLEQLQDRSGDHDHDHDADSDSGADEDSCATVLARITDDDLTARQLEVLRTAHEAGYFKSPREHSGEEIADMLDISGATFSEHLRTAQDKLFSAIFTP